MASSQYLHSNPLAEHNSGIALSSKQIPEQGSGNMYMGQAGRAFVQGGGGMSQFHSYAGGTGNDSYAHGSYPPVSVGYNSITHGGGSKKRRGKVNSKGRGKGKGKSKGRGKSKSLARKTMCLNKKCHKHCAACRSRRISQRRRRSGRNRFSQSGGGWGAPYGSSVASGVNAAYSIGGGDTGVGRDTVGLANPAPHTAYNSCHPVS